jgi:hypothetical protein
LPFCQIYDEYLAYVGVALNASGKILIDILAIDTEEQPADLLRQVATNCVKMPGGVDVMILGGHSIIGHGRNGQQIHTGTYGGEL